MRGGCGAGCVLCSEERALREAVIADRRQGCAANCRGDCRQRMGLWQKCQLEILDIRAVVSRSVFSVCITITTEAFDLARIRMPHSVFWEERISGGSIFGSSVVRRSRMRYCFFVRLCGFLQKQRTPFDKSVLMRSQRFGLDAVELHTAADDLHAAQKERGMPAHAHEFLKLCSVHFVALTELLGLSIAVLALPHLHSLRKPLCWCLIFLTAALILRTLFFWSKAIRRSSSLTHSRWICSYPANLSRRSSCALLIQLHFLVGITSRFRTRPLITLNAYIASLLERELLARKTELG